MLDLRRLWVLRAVARSGSLSSAARSLSYSTSAVSQQIAALEQEVGATLVRRGPRGVTLTRPGRMLADEAETTLTRLNAVEHDVRGMADAGCGTLRLGWFATAGGSLVPQSIAAFRARYPLIDLELSEGDPDACVPSLLSGDIEIALVYEFALAPSAGSDVEQVDLLDDPLHIGLPLDHPLARRGRVALDELAGEQWIQGVRHGATCEVLPRACREVGFEPSIILRTDDRTVVEGLVAAGVGIALVPQLTLPTSRTDIAVVPLDSQTLRRQVRVALAPAPRRGPATLTMLEVLRETARKIALQANTRLSWYRQCDPPETG